MDQPDWRQSQEGGGCLSHSRVGLSFLAPLPGGSVLGSPWGALRSLGERQGIRMLHFLFMLFKLASHVQTAVWF